MNVSEILECPSTYRLYIHLKGGQTIPKEYLTSSPLTAVQAEIETALGFTDVESITLVQVVLYGDEEMEFLLTEHLSPSSELYANLPVKDPEIPEVHSKWIWEKDKPHAREEIVVTALKYGDHGEVLVKTRRTDGRNFLSGSRDAWNDLSRFWEAVTPYNSEKNQEA